MRMLAVQRAIRCLQGVCASIDKNDRSRASALLDYWTTGPRAPFDPSEKLSGYVKLNALYREFIEVWRFPVGYISVPFRRILQSFHVRIPKMAKELANPSCFLYGPGEAKFEDSPYPTIEEPHDVVLRIAYVGVCGSDVSPSKIFSPRISNPSNKISGSLLESRRNNNQS